MIIKQKPPIHEIKSIKSFIPHECILCGNTFIREGTRAIHRYRVATNIEYYCSTCDPIMSVCGYEYAEYRRKWAKKCMELVLFAGKLGKSAAVSKEAK